MKVVGSGMTSTISAAEVMSAPIGSSKIRPSLALRSSPLFGGLKTESSRPWTENPGRTSNLPTDCPMAAPIQLDSNRQTDLGDDQVARTLRTSQMPLAVREPPDRFAWTRKVRDKTSLKDLFNRLTDHAIANYASRIKRPAPLQAIGDRTRRKQRTVHFGQGIRTSEELKAQVVDTAMAQKLGQRNAEYLGRCRRWQNCEQKQACIPQHL